MEVRDGDELRAGSVLTLPVPDFLALTSGESIIAFVERSAHSAGSEVELTASGTRRSEELKPAYRRWVASPPADGEWTAIVEEVHPAIGLDAEAGSSRHVLDETPTRGDILLLRIIGPDGPVLSDRAFAARYSSLSSALG
ncbi:MAG: hypothetical protein KJO84_05255 [Acidimicrobiia bacterium]|nr:hypothetical protein [Acidimicrobiia bacterium]